MSEDARPADASPVRRIHATVRLLPASDREEWLTDLEAQPETTTGGWRRDDLVAELRSRDHLEVLVELSAEAADGRRIRANGAIGLAGPRTGLGAVWHRYRGPAIPAGEDEVEYLQRNYRVRPSDIEDGINQMLGRDPELHRPPRLAWDNLIAALGRAGLAVTEEQLMAAPLVLELDAELQAALDRR
jgi:hypothetical protein